MDIVIYPPVTISWFFFIFYDIVSWNLSIIYEIEYGGIDKDLSVRYKGGVYAVTVSRSLFRNGVFYAVFTACKDELGLIRIIYICTYIHTYIHTYRTDGGWVRRVGWTHIERAIERGLVSSTEVELAAERWTHTYIQAQRVDTRQQTSHEEKNARGKTQSFTTRIFVNTASFESTAKRSSLHKNDKDTWFLLKEYFKYVARYFSTRHMHTFRRRGWLVWSDVSDWI